MSNEKNVRHRFSVPTADTVVNEWIENQSNLGFSLRVLIRAFVRQYGIGSDATCIEFKTPPPPTKGRPPKNRGIQLNAMLSDDFGNKQSDIVTNAVDDDGVDTNETVVVKETVEEPKQVETQNVTSDVAPNIMDMLNIGVSQPTTKSTTNVALEDDDFIDPDDLIG